MGGGGAGGWGVGVCHRRVIYLPHGIVGRQIPPDIPMPVKTLPSHNFVCGGDHSDIISHIAALTPTLSVNGPLE